MADIRKYQTDELLNKVLNSGEDALNVDLADSVTVTVDSEFPAAAAITDNFANPTTTSAMSMLMGYDGSAWDRVTIGGGTEATALRVTIASDSTGVLSIDDNGGNISIDDGGNTITVDGTVDLGSTATTHLSEIEGAVETIETTVGTDGSAGPAKTLSVGGTESGGNIQELRVDSDGHLQVDALSSALPSGAATAANQSTIIGHVDGVETLLGTIDSDTDAIKTAVEAVNQAGEGTISVSTQRVTIATDDDAVAHLGNLFYDTALAVTPSDGSDLSGEPYYAVWVGTGGDLKVDMADGGAAVTLSNCASGQLIPIMVERIYSTGTTASNIIAFK